MEAYSQFKEALHRGKHYMDYYERLVLYKDFIILDVALTNQKKVADSLFMSQAKFSAIFTILKVIK